MPPDHHQSDHFTKPNPRRYGFHGVPFNPRREWQNQAHWQQTVVRRKEKKLHAKPSERKFRKMKTNAHGDWAHNVAIQCHIKQGKIRPFVNLWLLGTCLFSFSPSFPQVFRSSGNACWSYNPCVRWGLAAWACAWDVMVVPSLNCE